MASILKRNNLWEVRVRRSGYQTQTKTFTHKSSAQTWAREAELALEQGTLTCRRQRLSMTLEEAVHRYLAEVSIHHKGHDVERYRLLSLLERLGRTKSLAAITSKDIATLKTDRLRHVSSGAVRRELNLLSSLFETAKNEWGATNLSNPVSAVKRPRDSAARDRRLTPSERHQLLSEAAKLANSQLYLAILIALETAMRQGEILNLRWDDVDKDREVISIRDAKNGHNRQVVISDRLAEHLSTIKSIDNAFFSVSASGLQQAFRKLTRQLQMHDL
ncbi:MAG: integrase, partial [Pseudomonadota bacterium]|nr:integrase [Pseudomonadota bacterium]